MDRKKTILIAVLINAGLLLVLFVAALTTQEEVMSPVSMEQVAAPSIEIAPFEIPQEVQKTHDAAPKALLPPVETAMSLPEPSFTQVPTPAPQVELPKQAPLFSEVVVKKGDSLEKIAKLNQTSVDAIIKLNQLPSSFLKVGQVLKIPSPSIKGASSPPSEGIYYTVKVGDSPWTIAMKHHMKVEELLRLNQLNEEKARKLKPGDRLRIR